MRKPKGNASQSEKLHFPPASGNFKKLREVLLECGEETVEISLFHQWERDGGRVKKSHAIFVFPNK